MTPEALDRAIDRILAGAAPDSSSDEQAVAAALASMSVAVPSDRGRADARRAVLQAASSRSRWHLRRFFVLAPLAASLAFGGVAVASRGALPGDPLYSVRRGLQAVHVAVAVGDASKAAALLDRSERNLDDAERALARSRESDARKALRVFDRDIASARAEIASVGGDRRAALLVRADELAKHADTLRLRAADDDGESETGDDSGSTSGRDGSDDSGSDDSSSDDSGSGSGSGSDDGSDEPDDSNSGSGSDDSKSGSGRDDSDSSGSGSGDSGSDDSHSGSDD
ncbi:MAG TPA: DUF5667 domain-containing protein [Actinomycetota bacterium]